MYPNWKNDFIDVNGARFHYTRTGEDGKPVIVLAHGFSDNGMCWMATARALEADYDVILPDARGHGLSQRFVEGEKVDAAADLAGLITALSLSHPVVGGHSMGASTAASMAARFPDLAKALVLEDPPWLDPRPEPVQTQEGAKEPPRRSWMEWLHTLPDLTFDEVIAKGHEDNPTWPDEEFPAWAESKKQLDLNIFKTNNANLNWREAAKAIRVPTLLLTADPEKGAIVTPEFAAVACQNPLIREVNIPGAGHNIRRENFPAYMQAVRQFLEETA